MNGLLILLIFILFLFAILACRFHFGGMPKIQQLPRQMFLPGKPLSADIGNTLKSAIKPSGSVRDKNLHVGFAETRTERHFRVEDRSVIGDVVAKT